MKIINTTNLVKSLFTAIHFMSFELIRNNQFMNPKAGYLNMNRSIYLLIFIVLALTSCTSPSNQSKILLKDINDAVSPTQIDFLELYSIFQPESDIMVGNIRKVLVFKSLYYIMDETQMKVLILDDKGKLVSEIDRKGHAYNEYIDLSDIFIDQAKQELYLLSREGQKLLVFDLEGKNLLRTLSVPKRFCSMEKTAQGYIGYMGNYTEDPAHSYNFFMLNEQMEIVGEDVEINPEAESRYNKDVAVFSNNNDEVSMIAESDYRIYRCTKGKFSVAYDIDLGDLSYPESEKFAVNDPIKQMQLDAKYVKRFQRVQETARYLFVYFMLQGQEYALVYDKNVQKTLCISLRDGVKDLFPAAFGNVIGTTKDLIICATEAKEIHDLFRGKNENNDFDKKYPEELKRFRQNVGQVDYNNPNPYIIVYEIVPKH